MLLLMRRTDLAWLAGLWEGEGCFMTGPPSRPHKPVIRLHMTDRDVVERAAHLMQVSVLKLKRRRSHYKVSYLISLRSVRAVEWMKKLRPWMGARRKTQIDRALACFVPRNDSDNATRPKLSRTQAARIRQRWVTEKYTLRDLAEQYSVSLTTIFRIVRNKRYKS